MASKTKAAVNFLSSRCDGAVEEDGQGFNGYDTDFGKKLAAIDEDSWSLKQRRAACKMLRKYRVQLSSGDINYDEILEECKGLDEDIETLESMKDAEETPLNKTPKFKTKFAKQKKESPKKPRVISLESKGFKGSIYWNFVVRNEFSWDIVNAFKDKTRFPKRFFEGKEEGDPRWNIPAKEENLEAVVAFAEEFDFKITAEAQEKIVILTGVKEAQKKIVELSYSEDGEIHVEGLKGELMSFQQGGVEYVLEAVKTGGVMIADEMGLGKTIQALASIEAAKAYPAVIICPASLKYNWEREAGTWLPDDISIAVINSGKIDSKLFEYDVVIINYDIVVKYLDALKLQGFRSIILDESHYCKTKKAKRTVACKKLAEAIPMKLALTGTPVLNRPVELTSQLEILGRLKDFGGFWNFAQTYCDAKKNRWGWDFGGATNLEELNQKLRSTCYIRRSKTDVLKELPAKQRATLPLDMDNRSEYDDAEDDLINWVQNQAIKDEEFLLSIQQLSEAKQKIAKRNRAFEAADKAERAEHLVRIAALKRIAARGKLESAKKWISDFLESGEKLVVFAHHKEVIADIAEAFSAPVVAGGVSFTGRQAAVDKFQDDPDCKVIVLNMKAGGVGLTLTAASNVAFLELGWNPGIHDQAEDRCHRIGQTDNVTAWYLLARDTIEEDIASMIEGKRVVVDKTSDGFSDLGGGKGIIKLEDEEEGEIAVEGSAMKSLMEKVKGRR